MISKDQGHGQSSLRMAKRFEAHIYFKNKEFLGFFTFPKALSKLQDNGGGGQDVPQIMKSGLPVNGNGTLKTLQLIGSSYFFWLHTHRELFVR